MEAFLISLTNQCSLGCLHSYRRFIPSEDSILTREEVEKAIQDISNLKDSPEKIIITGGEPLEWHHDGWKTEDAVVAFTRAGFRVEVITNGIPLMDKATANSFLTRVINDTRRSVTLNIAADTWHANYDRDENICYPIEQIIRNLDGMLDYSFKLSLKGRWLSSTEGSLNMPEIMRHFYGRQNITIEPKPLVIDDPEDSLYEFSPKMIPSSISKEGLGAFFDNICVMATGGSSSDDRKVFAITTNDRLFNRCFYHRYLSADGTYWRCIDGESLPEFKIGSLGEVSSEDIDNADSECPYFDYVRRFGPMKAIDTFLKKHPEDRQVLQKITNRFHPFAFAGVYGCSLCKTLAREKFLEAIGDEIALP
ncbi:MAG: hypothetical protein CVV64_05335 [Candidatus Wallbacteria bacterium HGW-Wallbacteria-1]|uniref:Radical SAM core domain-containing protein n=1 Tax=Candidatus Wallbacteria bacterium HGW-Wallbacteria-1 TaxID=2013854 RepID=A0A2N1PS82_9BACT|nr:MAG: hypothetical protein CVV64_05335 [Candidatus Wallbacteria bacterium HGW-Wallbacteria-1]